MTKNTFKPTALTAVRLQLCALALALGAAATPALALDVAGVNYQSSTKAGSTALRLNGAGVRQQANTALYTAGLYLEKKASTPQEVMRNKGAMQLRLVILREIPAKKLADLLTQGLMANTSDDELSELVSDIFNVATMIHEQGKLLPGDTFQIDSHPMEGTTVTIKGRGRNMPASQTLIRPGVFKAMMGIWLGDRPADAALKNALLGQSA
jgi:hypothetical protein